LTLILDASAYFRLFTPGCPPALRTRLAAVTMAHVPDVFDSEVINVARHGHLAGRYDHAAVLAIIAHLATGNFHRHPVSAMLRDMWALHDNLGMYDAAYAVLAARLGLPLVTADRKLAATPKLPCQVEVY
jgi:predicted nucleic acid-binding protein